ncbi:NAD(P)/FAD-dependent oxidoreductase [Colwellia sp. E2M01]|uniref:FAD-dependent oxidoreductase n=1 Tax=Colwellia sp. E2M01 TaxID=2841561 RepID=UPI001C08509D|nr:NAD(P)/FAD-dependent oxidoreductase [Colwellia sp. E2M01]MBU2869859.1 FAD-dependent monooxygenase [Colwellia sp. E2M01]
MKNTAVNWTICPECQGQGQKVRRLRKKVKLSYQRALLHFEKTGGEGETPVRPKGHLYDCLNCGGTGLLPSNTQALPVAVNNYPHVAIIGGGIGGIALAIACKHRGIPFTVYERDSSFDERSQGYGLTLQQASKAMAALGITSLEQGIISTRHVVHNSEGKIVGEWGIRKWRPEEVKTSVKRRNIHIARQSLRLALLQELTEELAESQGGSSAVQWQHQLVGINQKQHNKPVELSFSVNGTLKNVKADIVVGADGIRSTVRSLSLGESITPLRYLGCIVILGICPLEAINEVNSDLLDSATVFQTANGHERIYMMPFTQDSVMWQLSFPIQESEAKALSSLGSLALKEESIKRCQWHNPIPQILQATPTSKISGYPVYDRALLTPELLAQHEKITLIGDAAHPMSPFKGQGANQALLDALALARGISNGCRQAKQWQEKGVRASVLTEFEAKMLARSASKVKDSAEAAEFLHSEVVLHEGDEPRGRCLKTNN